MIGFGVAEFLVFIVGVLGIGILGSILWIWMLVDCATKESSEGNDKLVWIIIILFTHWIGATVYWFARRPRRKEELGR